MSGVLARTAPRGRVGLRGVLAVVLGAGLVVPAAAWAGKPVRSEHYDGSAQIRSAQDHLLKGDGNGAYGGRSGNVFAKNSPDGSVEDLFALYTGSRRSFTITFDGQTVACSGISHLFFESPGWWEKTDQPGKQALGSAGIWCDQPDDTAYAVRYPDYPRDPATTGTDCVVVQRHDDTADGERTYTFSAGGSADGLVALTSSVPCPAEVFYVTDVSGANRDSDRVWTGAAPFRVTALLG